MAKVAVTKKGLKEGFNELEFEVMKELVFESYGPNGSFELSRLSDFHNSQNDIIRCREWTKVVEIMAEAQKKGIANSLGYSWDELGEPLRAKIWRIKVMEPDLVPEYAIASNRSLCYFTLAVTAFRRATEPVMVISRKNRYGY